MQRALIMLSGIWGIGGVILLLVFAMFRLSPNAMQLTNWQLDWRHWTVLVLWSAFMIYSEGVRAFGKQFSPRAVARAQYLATQKRLSWQRIIFAPLFVMSYFGAPRRRRMTTYILTAGIIAIIVLVHFSPQPWRAIIDVGVILGLSYGTVTIFVCMARAAKNIRKLYVDPEVE